MVNVLIVDDCPSSIARGVELCFSHEAENSRFPISFIEARKYREAEKYINWVEVALVDGNLYGVVADKTDDRSGYALIEKIKEENPDSTVFLVSGCGRSDAPADCPFDHLLGLPFGVEGCKQIAETIEKYHNKTNPTERKE